MHSSRKKKVIVSNRSLVLQGVTRADSGVYTCTAHNAEGDGESNPITLDVRCKGDNRARIVNQITQGLSHF